jgi:hypothetical protein
MPVRDECVDPLLGRHRVPARRAITEQGTERLPRTGAILEPSPQAHTPAPAASNAHSSSPSLAMRCCTKVPAVLKAGRSETTPGPLRGTELIGVQEVDVGCVTSEAAENKGEFGARRACRGAVGDAGRGRGPFPTGS